MTKNKHKSNYRKYYKKAKKFLENFNPFFMVILTILIVLFMRVQNKISEDTARRQLRAYLMPTSPKLKIDPDYFSNYIGKRIEVSYSITNTGQTPAYDVRDSVHIKILPREEKPKTTPDSTRTFYYPVYGAGVSYAKKIHSGKNNVISKYHFVKMDSILIFNSIKFGIYFWGKIEYTDTFKKPHFTDFCYEFIFDKPIREFRTYGACNKADREEPYSPFLGIF